MEYWALQEWMNCLEKRVRLVENDLLELAKKALDEKLGRVEVQV